MAIVQTQRTDREDPDRERRIQAHRDRIAAQMPSEYEAHDQTVVSPGADRVERFLRLRESLAGATDGERAEILRQIEEEQPNMEGVRLG